MIRLFSPDAYRIFRELVRELRVKNGLTQRELARRLGVPQSFISKYETGERRLDFAETVFLCGVLEIGVDEFVTLFQERLRVGSQAKVGGKGTVRR
jgi:transcriptional regulator with XRE-family HTH domain